MVVHTGLSSGAKYLWTLPMFHCNGWTFPWSVTAAGGTHVVLDRPDPGPIWDALEAGATQSLCGSYCPVPIGRHGTRNGARAAGHDRDRRRAA